MTESVKPCARPLGRNQPVIVFGESDEFIEARTWHMPPLQSPVNILPYWNYIDKPY